LGKGTDKDLRKALQCYFRAAKAGDVHAMNDIGIYFANGYGVEKNEAEAFTWFKKASANEDYAEAMYNLATCYEAGFGTEPNIEEALRLKFLALKLEQNEENPDSVEIPIE
jgi:TPR repeat protein